MKTPTSIFSSLQSANLIQSLFFFFFQTHQFQLYEQFKQLEQPSILNYNYMKHQQHLQYLVKINE